MLPVLRHEDRFRGYATPCWEATRKMTGWKAVGTMKMGVEA